MFKALTIVYIILFCDFLSPGFKVCTVHVLMRCCHLNKSPVCLHEAKEGRHIRINVIFVFVFVFLIAYAYLVFVD